MSFSTLWENWLGSIIAIVIALAAACALVLLVWLIARLLGRRLPWVSDLTRRTRNAGATVVAVIAVWIACAITLADHEWWPGISRLFLVATILSSAWLLAALTSFGFEHLIAQQEAMLIDPQSRRRRTQLLVLHRLALVIIGVIAVGAVLFSFPAMRVLGASLLASAGIASIIAGLAAQSILGNLIAGIQLAFSDAIRVGDVVVVEGEWGRVGEINLTYVVIYIWDERRLIVPCIHFMSNPIETWTRHSDKIYGTVYLDLDWRVPMDEVRTQFQKVLDESELWDGRAASVVVTDAEGGTIKVRFVISAKDSDDQWSLRCEVREKMIAWMQREHPEALPRARVSVEEH